MKSLKLLATWLKRLIRWGFYACFALFILGAGAIGVAYWLISPRLPNVAEIRDIRLQVPLKVMTTDGKLMAVFGETRRTPVRIDQVPVHLKHAFIAVEDARFYEHPGIDVVGILRAVWLMLSTDKQRVPGGSTITQQVTRNFFLSSEYSITRKLSEIFLSLKLERELTKDEILELYLNKIFFGYRAYGVVAAADFYYGKRLDQLTLAECAMLASIPKFPSSGNPLSNPDRALDRRNYVLARMVEVGFIGAKDFRTASKQPDQSHPHEPAIATEASYLAEMVRQEAIARLGAEALTSGYTIYTTIDSRMQSAANAAVRDGLMAYDHRHGWRGAEARIDLAKNAGTKQWDIALGAYHPIAGLIPGVVTEISKDAAQIYLQDGQSIALDIKAMAWARTYITENRQGLPPKNPSEILKAGDIVRVYRDTEGNWALGQLPKAQAALVALDPHQGAIRALVGGFSFALSKFNRATQSNRQPGSSFKPFIYSAAFERGFTPASIVNDAPVVFADPSQPDGLWKPQNDNEEFYGPMRLREAMVQSRNLVSVRVLDAIGVRYAKNFVMNFGFTAASLPENLSLALGTCSVPPLTMARGYSVFANGGFLVSPYFIERIETDLYKTIYQAEPLIACSHCPGAKKPEAAEADLGAILGTTIAKTAPAQVGLETDKAAGNLAPRAVDERVAFLLSSVMRDVVKRGTGRGAMVLGRNDLAGKTGTTNEHRDAWFSGFNDAMVATVWVGFDDFTSLGRGEFASKAAIPIWTDFMRTALDSVPESEFVAPAGIKAVAIDPITGMPVAGDGGTITEFFKNEDLLRISQMQLPQQNSTPVEQQTFDIF